MIISLSIPAFSLPRRARQAGILREMIMADSEQPCSPPPGFESSVDAAPAEEGLSSKDRESIDSIRRDLMQRTDELLQEKVEKLLTSAAGQLQTSFDRQQEQLISSLETELQCCRENVKTLEADKEQMQKSVLMLQEQLAALTAQFYTRQCGWPLPAAMGGAGSLVNAGMMGPFATLPSQTVPGFESATSEMGEVSLPSTTAPPSPLTTPHPSAPPTPSRAAAGPPGIPPPPPPPGLSAIPTINVMPPPPGLTDSDLDIGKKAPAHFSAPISISAAIDASPSAPIAKPVLEEKAPTTLEELHRETLKRMQNTKDSDDPCPTSPVARVGTPGRNMASPKTTLNLTPKKTPRLSAGRLTPGKSPAVNASPFVICETGGTIFGFTIRKADDCSLGLDVNHSDHGNFLKVTGVKPGGAMQAWNKQCVGGPAAGKAVMPGDRIVKVNEETTPMAMLAICREQKLLKFTIQRGIADDDFDPLSLPAWGAAS